MNMPRQYQSIKELTADFMSVSWLSFTAFGNDRLHVEDNTRGGQGKRSKYLRLCKNALDANSRIAGVTATVHHGSHRGKRQRERKTSRGRTVLLGCILKVRIHKDNT